VLYGEHDKVLLEKLVQLKYRGYRIRERQEPIGDMQAVAKGDSGWVGLSDYRREGSPAAY